MPEKSHGRVGYEAYGAAADWTTFDGRPMPTWEQLGETGTGMETRRRWDMAASAIIMADTVADILALPSVIIDPSG